MAMWSISSFAQESNAIVNEEGKNISSLKHAWSARWITHPSASTLDYGVFNFRRKFKLDSIPNSFIIYVSADNRYRLYVNGAFICEGPSRGDIDHWRYETLDIAKHLQDGDNLIAVEVVNFGEFRHAKQQTFQTALILQGKSTNPVNINTSENNHWKVIKNEAYKCIPFVSDSVGGYYAAGPGDHITGKNYPWGWELPACDDSIWLSPRSAMVEFAVGRGFLYGSTWFLVPRTIPLMEESETRFKQIVRTENIEDPAPFITGKNPLRIPANKKISLLLDHQFHTIGHPELTVSGGENSSIKITYAEGLMYGKNAHIANGGWLKGNRNQVEGLEMRGYYDIYLPDGGNKRTYKPLGMRTFRYVQLDIVTGDQPLIIEDYHGIYSAYPFVEKAKFSSDDVSLHKIWETSWRTLRNSSTEGFEDPYYEQLQYIGDTRIESLVSIFVSGDDRLMRKAIQQFDDSRLTIGLTQSRYPSYIVQVIPPYSLLWIGMMHDFLMYRNDPEFLRQFLPGIEGVLAWFDRNMDKNGMLGSLEWWNFTDWSNGFTNGIPPGADDGNSANLSLQYALALNNASDIFRCLSENEQADKYMEMSKSIQKAVYDHCFDQEKGLIAERHEKDVFSQHTNIFGIISNTFKPDEQKMVMKKVLEDQDLIQASIYFRFYLNRALLMSGMGDRYLTMLSPWNNMLAMGMTTFGETDEDPRSDCHGWSASPCFDFLNIVAGIQSVSPGFKKVLIEPNLGHLNKISASIPHPDGMLEISLIKNKKGQISGNIKLPEGIEGIFKGNGSSINLKSGDNEI
jgi:hypothetical protein